MKILNLLKAFNAIPPGAIKDNAAFTGYVIDKQTDVPQGASGVLFLVSLGATDVAASALKVQQSDTKSNTTTLGGTPADVKDTTTKPAATDDNGIFGIYVPMSKWTERYLQLQATAGNGSAGTYLSAIALFEFPGYGAPTAAAMGLTSLELA